MGRYLCSNPNCRKVFSRPKIITYHVCPTCQTLVTIAEIESHEEIQTDLAPKKSMEHRKLEMVEADNPKDMVIMNIPTGDSQSAALEEPCEPDKKQEVNSELIVLEQVQASQPKKIEIAPIQQVTAEETKAVSASSSDCQYGFGYLSQREKGEGIPDSCIECPKLLSCMLSEYYKAEESVKEIKKWYNF
jgi:hypothetical protein